MPTFDLTEAARYYLRFNRIARAEMIAGGIGLLAFWGYGLPVFLGKATLAWSTGRWDDFILQALILALIPPTVLFLFYTALIRMGMGPVRLDVTDTGLTFTYLNHNKFEYRWRDPIFKLEIRDSREMPLVNPLLAIKVPIGAGRAFIPPEALDVIKSEAGKHGLSMSETREVDSLDSSRTCRIICVRPARGFD